MKKYDAVAFLKSLFEERPEISSPDDLPGDWRIEFEERAAELEIDGGLPREHAEALALRDTINRKNSASTR